MTAAPPAAAVRVRHGGGEYPVYVARGLVARAGELVQRHAGARRLAVIADRRVASLHGQAVAVALRGEDGTPPLLTFPAGERSKTRGTWARLSDELLARGFGRETAIVALGGGVTGDLAGFVAATFLRGVPVVQMPTTLLAMVDSAIGGKTGVDAPGGKNLIGAYHAPAAVLADLALLESLEPVHFRGGLAEAVKHGLMLDEEYFAWIERSAAALAGREPDAVERLVQRSAELKAAVVEADERDAGRRALLNAGHTIAHAIERAAGWTLPHGDAVAIGLVTEARLAAGLGIAEPDVPSRLVALLRALGLPTAPADLPVALAPDAILAAAAADKKNRAGELHFAFPAAPGRAHATPHFTTPAPAAAILAALTP